MSDCDLCGLATSSPPVTATGGTRSRIRENIVRAFLYNAVAMATSSVIVASNSRRPVATGSGGG